MVGSPAMFYCKSPLEMQLKPLTVTVIALKGKTIIIFRGAYCVQR